MKEFDYNGDTMVNGAVLKAYLSAFGPYHRRGEQVLCKYFGVKEIKGDPDSLYALAQFLKALDEFQKQFGQEFMKKVGEGIFANAVFPPGIDSVDKAMASINQAYYINHKTKPGEIGGYHWQKLSENKGVMMCDNPYPCKFDQGILEVIARTFSPNAKVRHDDEKGCRNKNGLACSYVIEW